MDSLISGRRLTDACCLDQRAAVGSVRGLNHMERTAARDTSRGWLAGDVRSRVCYRRLPLLMPDAPLHLPVCACAMMRARSQVVRRLHLRRKPSRSAP
ncbi:hypothetical protein EVAR_99023_1 [Eumeta japonica]|uniref:Uncharacterized protein n=1 Tax=Eumeta variegata TaxID=151549 RepID=A0A4C1Y047_EUMVA|nr:hypothetical protein EVAR_99023_1 [Eumeta japonica]